MIAALVLFQVGEGSTLEQLKNAYEQSAPHFANMPGLLSKYYIYDGKDHGGAFYLWSSRREAEAFFDDKWREALTRRYGDPPSLSIFEVPVVINNISSGHI